MKVEDLTLDAIQAQAGRGLVPFNARTVRAVAYAARRGHSDKTAALFAVALSLVERNVTFGRESWPRVLLKIKQLQAAADLTALRSGQIMSGEIGDGPGDFEGAR
jgi:hypothetical protein